MAARQLFAADSAGGTVDVDGTLWPPVTRDQALQLVEYWVDQTKRNMIAPPAFWYPIAIAALGYEKPGDRFRAGTLFNTAFATSLLPSRYLPQLWNGISTAASDLDEVKLNAPRPFAMSKSLKARWMRVARNAWARMQKEREAAGESPPPAAPFPPPEIIPRPKKPPVKPVLPEKPRVGLWLALLALFAIEGKRSR